MVEGDEGVEGKVKKLRKMNEIRVESLRAVGRR